MKLYFLGIGGTLMANLSLLAKAKGHEVSGMDENLYPPMSILLEKERVVVDQTFNKDALLGADQVVVGNAISRGHIGLEFCLDSRLAIISSAQWLYEHLLCEKKVIAIAGTHGKTTTTALVVWMLKNLGLDPSFLIGGQTHNFDAGAYWSEKSTYFVVEADEYDTAFFDKRSKFIHYRPHILLINNLEFDHVDIFKDLRDIQTQFHHLIRTLSNQATVIHCVDEQSVLDVLKQGLWSNQCRVDFNNLPFELSVDHDQYTLVYQGRHFGPIDCDLMGEHNKHNMVMALFVAQTMGIDYPAAFKAMDGFLGVKRRLENLQFNTSIVVYSDFAHHPSAVRLSIDALKKRYPNQHLHVLMFAHSNTLKSGHLKKALALALGGADYLWLPQIDAMSWQWQEVAALLPHPFLIEQQQSRLVKKMVEKLAGDAVLLVMSNGRVEHWLDEIKMHLEPTV